MTVPLSYAPVIRRTIRDLYLDKKCVPTLDMIYEKVKSLKFSDITDCNIFQGNIVVEPDSPVWTWCGAALYRFMKSIGFVHKGKVSHYEYTKTGADVIAMRDNYLEWINRYREDGFQIFYQDETWVFKNMHQKKQWIDESEGTTKDLYRVPSGSGERAIFSHFGSCTGLQEN